MLACPIRDLEKMVAGIVVRLLEKVKPDKWGFVQSHEFWSPKEEVLVWEGSWKHELCREGVQVDVPTVRGV